MGDFEDVDLIRDELKIVWKRIVDDLRQDPDFQELTDVMGWMETVMESNVPFGKQSRATAIAVVYRHLIKERDPDKDFGVYVMGWVTEVIHTFALIADDIMDGSKVRRGKPAWHTRADVGLTAINDAILLENLTWKILRKYFHSTVFYEKLLFLLQDTAIFTILGQSLDTRFSINGDFTKFTRDTYDTIVKYKTSIYSFYTPVAIAMILAGIEEKEAYRNAKKIVCEIGRLFQIQDDYLDLYGDPKQTGKVGTDIIDGKCSWLVVEALERGSIDQKLILQEHYGSKKIEDVQKVEQVYNHMNLKRVFLKFETSTYDSICTEISACEPEALRTPLTSLLNIIYKRKK